MIETRLYAGRNAITELPFPVHDHLEEIVVGLYATMQLFCNTLIFFQAIVLVAVYSVHRCNSIHKTCNAQNSSKICFKTM